jgi:hypothetical protein
LGGAYNWAYGRPNMSVGERLVFQMDELGIDMMCIMTSDHRRVYPHEKGPFAPNEFLVEVRDTAPDRLPRSRSYFKRDGELATSMEFSDRSQYCEPLL